MRVPLGFVLVPLLACSTAASTPDDAGGPGCADAARPTGPGSLYPCPGATISPTPDQGLCPEGSFPNMDVSCGPPFRDADGGFTCGCRVTGDKACQRLCACDADCPSGGKCTRVALFWGSDTTSRSVSVCR